MRRGQPITCTVDLNLKIVSGIKQNVNKLKIREVLGIKLTSYFQALGSDWWVWLTTPTVCIDGNNSVMSISCGDSGGISGSLNASSFVSPSEDALTS